MTSLKFSIKIELLDFGQITYLISVNAIASTAARKSKVKSIMEWAFYRF
jgi:hypothetical protein